MTGLKLLKKTDNSIEVELVGEDHTIANLIAKYAIRKPYVVYSSYIISHPLVGNPIIVLTTDGSKDPLDVIEETLKEIIEDTKTLRGAIEEATGQGAKCET